MNSQRHFLTLVNIYTDFLSPFYDTSVLTLGRHGYPVVFCAAYPDECASCMRLVSFFFLWLFFKAFRKVCCAAWAWGSKHASVSFLFPSVLKGDIAHAALLPLMSGLWYQHPLDVEVAAFGPWVGLYWYTARGCHKLYIPSVIWVSGSSLHNVMEIKN